MVQSKLTEKAKILGGSWTAEAVGKVLWIVSIFSAHGRYLDTTKEERVSKGGIKGKKGIENGKQDVSDLDDENTKKPSKRQRKT